MRKRILSLLLALTLCVGLAVPALAASDEAVAAADRLNALGLFNGVGNNADGTPNYDLDRAPTRMEAVTLLVRLLGKGAEAESGNWTTPFTDVADWAKPYVGYAYANDLTAGTSATTFSGTDTVSATQYLTFVLRALGYSSDSDFQWNKAWELTDTLGITNGEYGAASAFTRGDAVLVSANALDAKLKDGSKTLLEAIEEALASAPTTPVEPATPTTDSVTLNGTATWLVGDTARPGYSKQLESPLTTTIERISDYEAIITWQTDFLWTNDEVTSYTYSIRYEDDTEQMLSFVASYSYSKYSGMDMGAGIGHIFDDMDRDAFAVSVLQEDTSAGLLKLRITLPETSTRNLGMIDLGLIESSLGLM